MAVLVNMAEIWQNCIDDAIEHYREYLDFTVMTLEEFKEECINLIKYYFDNDMIGLKINYNDMVSDTAKDYEMWRA